MTFSAEISRRNPTLFLFLVDQSSSMAKPVGGQGERTKADGVADAINRLLFNLVMRCAKDEIRDYFHVGLYGYHSQVRSAFPAALGGDEVVPISLLANNPLRVEDRTRKADDGAGGVVTETFKFPIWLEPVARGKTFMCQALQTAAAAAGRFLQQYPDCYPPVVINITDGKANDGNPLEPADRLRALHSSDGHVLLLNLHLSSSPLQPVYFPARESALSDPAARLLFRMSSELPESMCRLARLQGFELEDHARGLVFNADMVSVVQFLDIGTRGRQPEGKA